MKNKAKKKRLNLKLYLFFPTCILTDSYRKLKIGMNCKSIIQSSSTEFNSLDLITDIFIPDCNVWCGDYPYLNKLIFQNFIASFEQQLKGSNLFSRKAGDSISSRKLPDNLSRVYKKN